MVAPEGRSWDLALSDLYHDPTFPPRACDNCGALYTGPSLYCSLTCAIADSGAPPLPEPMGPPELRPRWRCFCCDAPLLKRGAPIGSDGVAKVVFSFLVLLGYTRESLLGEHRDRLEFNSPGLASWLEQHPNFKLPSSLRPK